MALTDEQMKKELGVLPLGHRAALLRAVKQLAEMTPASEGVGKVRV